MRAFDLLKDIDPPLDEILVSDAGKTFRIVRPKPLGMIGRAMCATDILWDRVGRLEKQNFESDPRFLFVPALDFVDRKEDPTALDPVIQPEVANIRTDIDRFSSLEIKALVQHGYCVARKQCRSMPELFGNDLPSSPPWDPLAIGKTTLADQVTIVDAGTLGSFNASELDAVSATAQAEQLHRSAGRRVWSTLLDFRDWPTYIYILLLVLLLGVVPVQVWQYRRQARPNAMIVEAITNGSPDFRKILELVKGEAIPTWTPHMCVEVSMPSSVDYQGFEFLRDTHILNLRDWQSKTRDVAHFYRRIHVRRLSEADRLIIQWIQPYDRVDFRCGPLKLNPVIRRIPPKTGERDTTWELDCDLSDTPPGMTQDIEIEAIIHDVEADKGQGETWSRYRPVAKTSEVSIWLLFPEYHPYRDYNLVRFPIADPSTFQKVETLYTIDHPRGSIIALSLINPDVGYVYECNWTME